MGGKGKRGYVQEKSVHNTVMHVLLLVLLGEGETGDWWNGGRTDNANSNHPHAHTSIS